MSTSTYLCSTLPLAALLSCWILLVFPSSAFSTTKSPQRCQRLKNMRLWSNPTDNQEERVVVALTREEGKNDKLREALLSHPRLADTITLEELPCIAHADGPDLAKLGATLTETCWDYVAVTSPEAARVLAGAWNNVFIRDDSTSSSTPPKVAAVGKATQKELERCGIPVAFCPSKATAQTLVEELPAKEGEATTTLLYPSSAKAKRTLQDGLMARRFAVTRLDTYDTVTATWTEEQQMIASLSSVACFGSPSAAKGWLKNSGNDRKVLAACIGETSAQACRELKWVEDRIFYPEKPGVPGWVDAVADALESITIAHHA